MADFDDWDELGPPQLRPVPEGRSRGRVVAIVVAVVLVVAVLSGVVVALFVSTRTQSAPKPAATPSAGADATVTESFQVTASGTATVPVLTTTPEATTTPPPAAAVTFTRAPRVAYRKDGALWVSDEAGAASKRVVASASGAFSLAPDGSALAFVDGKTKLLAVAQVESATVTTVGPAEVRTPVWAPSSRWLAYTAAGEVRRVERDGSKPVYLGRGTHVAIGPDAKRFAYATEGAIVVVDEKDGPRRVGVKGRVDDLVLGQYRVFYAVGGTTRSALALHSVSIDGSGDRTLAGPPPDPQAGRYDELALSPDDAWLAYAAAGDDLHSRLRAMHSDGTADTPLSLRRDDYLLRWSADGSRVLFIDGNVLQGDATQLMSIRPDGSSRATILDGAGM